VDQVGAMSFTDDEAQQSPFTDDDLFFWKNLCGNHLTDEENLEIHAMTLRDLIARLEAAENFIFDPKEIDDCGWCVAEAYDDKRQLVHQEDCELNLAYKAWRKAAGK
jgi:hypothetical protein